MTQPARIYLRPLGLLEGQVAKDALHGGWALPLEAGDLAFTGCEVWLRDSSRIARRSLPAAGVRAWAAAQSDPVRQGVEAALLRLKGWPELPAGLPRERPLLMGVLNVTPDSFSDGGLFLETGAAIEQGRRLAAEGAAIVDVGGESTRPGSQAVPLEEELRRVLPVVRALAGDGICVSIDTRKAAVMAAALEAGARIVNDVSALQHDPDSLGLVASRGATVVLMHCQGEPATMQVQPIYDRAALDVYDHLEARIQACEAGGIDRTRLIVDPGIGFGKTVAHNLEILHHLGIYHGLGVALLLGVSRKSFIARAAGEAPVDQRLGGSLAAALFGYRQGASILRVHDVAATRQAVRIWNAMKALT